MLPLNEESTQRVEGVMTLHPHAVTGNDPIPYAARIMGTARVGFLPVLSSVAGRHLIGVITDRDVAVRHTANCGDGLCDVRAHMTPGPVFTVRATDDVAVVMDSMRRHRVHRVPVVDDEQRLVGVVSLTDLIQRTRPRPSALLDLVGATTAPSAPEGLTS